MPNIEILAREGLESLEAYMEVYFSAAFEHVNLTDKSQPQGWEATALAEDTRRDFMLRGFPREMFDRVFSQARDDIRTRREEVANGGITYGQQ